MRIDPKPRARYPWYLRPFFWNQERKYGKALDSALLWARTPRVFIGVAILYGILDRKASPIDPVLRSLVTVRVSQINACGFCIDINSAMLLKRGVPPAKVTEVSNWRDSDLFDAKERLALEYAETMTRPDSGVDDGLVERLRRHFDDDTIIELTGLIGFQNMSSKFNNALAVLPQGFCELPNTASGGSAPAPS